MSVNGVSLENVDYGTAVSVLRDSGAAVNLVVKRRIVLGAYPEPITYKVTLTKSKKKDGNLFLSFFLTLRTCVSRFAWFAQSIRFWPLYKYKRFTTCLYFLYLANRFRRHLGLETLLERADQQGTDRSRW